MGWLNTATIIIMAAFFTVGLFELAGTVGMDALKNKAAEDPGKTVAAAIGFNQGLNAITPAFRYDISEKVPLIGGKRIFLINDIPLPDGTDMIILIPALFLWFLALKGLRGNINSIWWGIIAIFGTIIIIPAAWMLIKLFWYGIYLWSAKALGWTIQQAKDFRDSVIISLGNVIYGMVLFSAFSVIAMAKVMIDAIWGNKDG